MVLIYKFINFYHIYLLELIDAANERLVSQNY